MQVTATAVAATLRRTAAVSRKSFINWSHPRAASKATAKNSQMSGPEDPAVDLLRFENVTADYIIHRGFEIEARTAAADTKQ
jgi:hypothetical protein